MARLNIQKAQAMGYSPEEISAFLQKNPQLAGANATPVSQAKSSLLVNLLPLLASIAGGAAGAPLGPMGLIAGSAIGSGLGEAGRQGLSGEKSDLRKIGTESLLGAASGGAGVLLGGAAKAGQAVKAGSKASKVAKATKALKLTAGEKAVAKPYTSQAYKTFAKQGGDVATKVTNVSKTINSLGKSNSPSALNALSTEKQGINEMLEKATQGKKAVKIKIPTMGVVASVDDELASRAINIKAGAGKTAYTYWKPRVEKVENLKELSQLHIDISAAEQAAGGLKTKEGRALNAIRTGVMKQLNEIGGTEKLMKRLGDLKQAEPIIAATAGKSGKLFGVVETQIPQRIQEMGQFGIGNTMKFAGKTLGSPLGRQVGGQAGARMLLGGGGDSGGVNLEGYEAPTAETPTSSYTSNQQEQPKLNITPEMVAMAMLTMPSKQANALKAAYDILNKKSSVSASQEFLDKAVNTINAIKGQGSLGFGPVKGRAYDMDINLLGGSNTPGDVVALNQKYTVLRLNLLRAYQGARISDKDYELASKYIPNLYDTESTAATKLQILQQLLLSAPPPTEAGSGYEQTD